MKKTTTTLLICLLSWFRLMGQIDYLEPVRDYTQYQDELSGYYCNVFSLLNHESDKQPYAQYTALPSFSPEYTVFAESQENNRYLLVSNTLSQNSWQAEKDRIKVNRKSVAIGKALYQAFGELLQFTTGQIQDMDGTTTGLDGTTYYFSATNSKGQTTMGKKWSPDSSTLMGRLVQICESAYALSIGKQIPESLIVADIQTLLSDLRNRSKAFPDEYKQPKYAGIFPVGEWQSIETGRELEEVPELPEGTPEEYALQHTTYPSSLLTQPVKGYALCQFTVNREGKVVNAHILNYSHTQFAEEALRVVKQLPKFRPATSGNQPVACNYTLYLPFRPPTAQSKR